jgi:putative acetyltransferase
VVLENDGVPVGHLLLERLRLAVTSHVVQLTIVVHPGHTSQGYGRILMDHAIEWARRSPDIEKIELRVRSCNSRAIALYRSLGFEVEGTLKRRIKLSEGYADDICMSLFVDEPVAEQG